jgi:GntR family transcriptional regulator
MSEPAIGLSPLYIQVRDELTRRLAKGRWRPGTSLPSEQGLAREMGVSQGTVRKALDGLAADHILVRKQGRGTFVAEFEESRILFQFFRLWPDSGERMFPTSKVLSRTTEKGSARERAALGLGLLSKIVRVERVRYHGRVPILREILSLPAGLFPGFNEVRQVPNNVYQFYSERWGIRITKTKEKLKAVAADTNDRRALGCAVGDPLLLIERLALDINTRPVEYRRSFCLTTHMHYASDVT